MGGTPRRPRGREPPGFAPRILARDVLAHGNPIPHRSVLFRLEHDQQHIIDDCTPGEATAGSTVGQFRIGICCRSTAHSSGTRNRRVGPAGASASLFAIHKQNLYGVKLPWRFCACMRLSWGYRPTQSFYPGGWTAIPSRRAKCLSSKVQATDIPWRTIQAPL